MTKRRKGKHRQTERSAQPNTSNDIDAPLEEGNPSISTALAGEYVNDMNENELNAGLSQDVLSHAQSTTLNEIVCDTQLDSRDPSNINGLEYSSQSIQSTSQPKPEECMRQSIQTNAKYQSNSEASSVNMSEINQQMEHKTDVTASQPPKVPNDLPLQSDFKKTKPTVTGGENRESKEGTVHCVDIEAEPKEYTEVQQSLLSQAKAPEELAHVSTSLTPEVATRVAQHVLFQWIKSSVPFHVIFTQEMQAKESISFADFEVALSNANAPLTPLELAALRLTFGTNDSIGGKKLHEFMTSKLFPVELLEYQLRTTLLEKSTKSRGNYSLSKTIAQLLSSTDSITPESFRTALVEKLALSSSLWIIQCLFCRILHAPLAQVSPRKHFQNALERFVQDVQLDGVSIESVFRRLLDTNVEASFRALDTDHSGTLSINECAAFLRQHHVIFPENVLKDFLKRFDRDGDGTLSLSEFIQFCRPKQQRGIHVLSAFGFFYVTIDPMELVEAVVARIHKRLFWLQHNHLICGNTDVSKTRLTVDTSKISLWRHFGALRFTYNVNDTVQSVLANGELIVIKEVASNQPSPKLCSKERYAVQRPPPLNVLLSVAIEQPPEPPPPPEIKLRDEPAQNRKVEKPGNVIQWPKNVCEWTSLHVKKWLIYDLQLKTIASKFSFVDGKMLLEWSTDPNLDVRLRDQFKIHLAIHRHKIVKRIRQLTGRSTIRNAKVISGQVRTNGEREVDVESIHNPQNEDEAEEVSAPFIDANNTLHLEDQNSQDSEESRVEGNYDPDIVESVSDSIPLNNPSTPKQHALDYAEDSSPPSFGDIPVEMHSECSTVNGDETLPLFSDETVVQTTYDDEEPPPPFE